MCVDEHVCVCGCAAMDLKGDPSKTYVQNVSQNRDRRREGEGELDEAPR